MKLRIILISILALVIVLLALILKRSNQNIFLEWAHSVEIGTPISEVKKQVPDNFDVDWSSLDTTSNRILVTVTVEDFDLDPLYPYFYLEFDSTGGFINGFARF